MITSRKKRMSWVRETTLASKMVPGNITSIFKLFETNRLRKEEKEGRKEKIELKERKKVWGTNKSIDLMEGSMTILCHRILWCYLCEVKSAFSIEWRLFFQVFDFETKLFVDLFLSLDQSSLMIWDREQSKKILTRDSDRTQMILNEKDFNTWKCRESSIYIV